MDSSAGDHGGAAGAIPLRFSEVDVAHLASSTLEPLRDEAGAHDVTLTIDAPAAPVVVRADPEKLAWIIATLVGNALRYVRRGTRRLPGGSIVVRIRRDQGSDVVSILVEDDGPGIAPDKLCGLFERRSGAQHAAGLALALVRDIAIAHGGNATVESSTAHESHGTTVCVTLPV